MKQILFLFIVALAISSCSRTPSDIIDYKQTWVYVELEVITQNDTTDYYYYGQVNQQILDKIAYNKDYNGLFILTNVRYYDDSDVIKKYNDDSDFGTLFFRIQDIVKIDVLKNDPFYDKNYQQKRDSINSLN